MTKPVFLSSTPQTSTLFTSFNSQIIGEALTPGVVDLGVWPKERSTEDNKRPYGNELHLIDIPNETKPSARPGLTRLPYEILSYIVQHLSLETIFDLAQTCRGFQYLITEENICKMLLRKKASYSLEAREAAHDNRYARGLRRLVKSRRALAQASPFAMSIIGVADSYALHHGRVLYIVGDRLQRRLHILDLLKATNQECVVDVPALASLAVPQSEGCRKYTFRVLYHAANITSCLYSFARPRTENYLLIFNAQKQRLLASIQLESTIRLFVRNNDDHLIFGTHSAYGASVTRRWVLRHFNIRKEQLTAEKTPMADLVGYEIGSTVCFEVFDNYFYGCSNQASFELEEIDWTSHYHCFRIPLDEFTLDKIEVMNKRDAFRRQHKEGPIDDRWTFLKFEQDEETGIINIMECRREWPNGGSENRRTYYTKTVKFTQQATSPDALAHDDNENDTLPDDQRVLLLSSSDRPSYYLAPPRLQHEYQRGDNGYSMFSRSNTYFSSYSNTCGTFIDLVNDPHPDEPLTQRPRIRTGLRNFDAADTQLSPQETSAGLDEACQKQGNIISYWPPDATLATSKYHADTLEKINKAMSPDQFQGDIAAAGDHRHIVYSTGSGETGAMKVLILLSFDPATRMVGMTRAGCVHAQVEDREMSGDRSADSRVDGKGQPQESCHGALWPCRIDHCMQEEAAQSASPLPTVPWSAEQDLDVCVNGAHNGPQWASLENAMHQQFTAKYCFSPN